MKTITLSQGKVALVDDANFDLVIPFRWHAVKIKDAYYARDNDGTYMHRLIMGAGPGEEVDHRDGDGLNNQRFNLRRCTHLQNLRNTRIQTNGSSKYKGVGWRPEKKKWRARIMVNGQDICLGHFNDELAAAMAYDKAAKVYFGEFARTNGLS